MPADKFPGGTVGIVLASTDENAQEDQFFHCDPRLVAVNVNGDPEMASLVYDLNENSEYDSERGARLHSMMRVLKKPLGAANAIAWQLGSSGFGDAGGGWVIDNSVGGGKFAIGTASADSGGPLDVGDGKCRHQHGKDADGNPIGALHITTRALFRMDNAHDGPIRFEPTYEEGEDGWKVYPVHLGWTGADWALYTKIGIGPTPMPTPTPRPRPRPKPPINILPIPWDTPAPVPTPGPRPGPFQLPPPTPTPGPRPPVATPGPPIGGLIGGLIGAGLGGAIATPGGFGGGLVGPTSVGTLNQPAMETHSPVATPSVGGRPQTTDSTKLDTSSMSPSDFAGSEAAQNQFAETPLSGSMTAFGAQGGTTTAPAAYSDETTGGSGDPWAYKQKPKKSRFYSGTVPGGFIFLPPEVQMGDHDSGFAPNGIDVSDTFVIAGPNVYFGAGNFNETNGRVEDGFSWGMDPATGDLVFKDHTGGVHEVEALRLQKMTGRLLWRGTTGKIATLTHSNNADVTYTFPNFQGQIVVSDTSSDPGAGATALLGKIGGSGPTNTHFMNKWERIMCKDGRRRWVPCWI